MLKTLLALIATALTAATVATAAPPDLAALGYQVSAITDASTGCRSYHVTGYGADETFDTRIAGLCYAEQVAQTEAAMVVFAAGHDERKLGFEHADALLARSAVQGKGYAVATDYAGPSFTVTGGCQGSSKVDAAGLVELAKSLPAAAEPCPPAPPADPPPPTPIDPAVDARIRALEAEVARLQAEIAELHALIDALTPGTGSVIEAVRIANAITDAAG